MHQTQEQAPKKRRGLKITLLAFAALLLILAVTFFVYTGIYYRALPEAQAILTANTPHLSDTRHFTAIVPPDATTGYILYPGAKVESAAYLPYLQQVAQGGTLCAVLKSPFHLAILGPNGADQVIRAYPQITTWVVGGHSLGGVVAAGYAANNPTTISGLILLASYPNQDLSAALFPAASITGSNDGVLNWASFNSAKALLPPSTKYTQIQGGNHGQFGAYGFQKGDGEATISPQEQQNLVAEATNTLLESARAYNTQR